MGTVIALPVLVLLRLLQGILPLKPEIRIEVAVSSGSRYDGAASKPTSRLMAFTPVQCPFGKIGRRYALLLSGQDKTIDCDRLLRFLQDAGEMQQVAIGPLENDSSGG